MGLGKNKSSSDVEPFFLFGEQDAENQKNLRNSLYNQLMPALPGLFPKEMGMSEAERQKFGSQSMGDLAAAQTGESGRIEEDMSRRGMGGGGTELKELDINRDRYARERGRALTDLEKFNLGLKRQDRGAFTGNIRELLGSSGNTSHSDSKGFNLDVPMKPL